MTSNDYIYIRKMCADDLDAVAQIEAENFSIPWKRSDFAHYLDNPQAVFLVAVCRGCGGEKKTVPEAVSAEFAEKRDGSGRTSEKIGGYIGCLYAADEGDITNVSVDSACRRNGIGQKLVQALLTESEQRGCIRIFLEVRQSNEAAVRLYRMHGFQEIGVRKKYYQKPEEDALLMRYENMTSTGVEE